MQVRELTDLLLWRPKRAVGIYPAVTFWGRYPALRGRLGHFIRDKSNATCIAVETGDKLLEFLLLYKFRPQTIDA